MTDDRHLARSSSRRTARRAARSTSASRCGPATGRSWPPATRSCPGRAIAERAARRAARRGRGRALSRRGAAGAGDALDDPRAGPAGPLRRGRGATGRRAALRGAAASWRIAAGEHAEPIDTPVAGVVRDVRPGIGIRVRAEGRVIARRRGARRPDPRRAGAGRRSGRRGGPAVVLRHGSLDVGLAGTILVVGSRVDAEALTRARAMGVRGVVVGGLAGKERRDFLASEARQRAALHRLPPFAVLVLDGARPAPDRRPGRRRARGARRPRGRDRRSTRRPSSSTSPAVELAAAAAGPRPGPGRRARRSRGPLGGPGRPPPVRRRRRSSRRLGRASATARRSPIPLADLERFV